MTSYVAKIVSKRLFKEGLENKFGASDPYFEHVPATRLDGSPKGNGKTKKVRKAIPPGLSDHDAAVLNKVKRRAYRLDMSFGSFAGIKFGWGSIIGLVPIAGDFVDAFLALLVVRTACQVEGGLPASVRAQMQFWILVDLIAGLVPFAGDIADAIILANTRNASLLEDYLRKKGQKNLRKSGLPVPDVDPSDPAEFDRYQAAGDEGHTPQASGVMSASAPPPQPPRPTQPEQARVRNDPPAKSGGGRFGFGSKKSRPADVEMGR
ncbi:hypothetical protein GGR56DRAFT_671696 [Xylariaceae sp. FL0804]|nr:hypothetical protein GGR56DRAFT_671696 [Xylariaceae sp. FL0804]